MLLPIFQRLIPAACVFLLCAAPPTQAQTVASQAPLPFAEAFQAAYAKHPQIPRGLLEAVAWSRTRIRDVQPNVEAPSCAALPGYWGPMGLVEDGGGWFRSSLSETARWGGGTPEQLRQSAEAQIAAFADALFRLSVPGSSPRDPLAWDFPLLQLSELPLSPDDGARFALDSWLYEVFSRLNDPAFCRAVACPSYQLDLESYFGSERWQRLVSPFVLLQQVERPFDLETAAPESENRSAGPCYDFPGVNWVAASASNYSSRSGTAISAVTIHTMQGYYAGTISWFQNPAAGVSAHYCVRSSDGQITQMVCEADKAWHVGSENAYTVGIEHEGFVSDPSWYTTAMYNSSAALTRNIAQDAAINRLRTYFKAGTSGVLTLGGCTRIKGHQHFPGASHTDPGEHWNWTHYYKLVNEPATSVTLTAASGSVFDPGGSSGSYGDDERSITTIQPPGATSIALSFSSFNLENNWDYLFVYGGEDIYAPLLGTFTGTTLPPALNSSGGSMTLEFRSDCATVAPGFAASWTSSGSAVCGTPTGTWTGPIGWTSATINWTPEPSAIQYQVAGRRAGLGSWRYLYTPLSSKWLGIFQNGNTYEWRVRAECPGTGWSGWSVTNTFTTNTLREGWSDQAESLESTTLQCWPVPVSDVLHVQSRDRGQLTVYDATGRLMYSETAAAYQEMDCRHWPDGWYVLRWDDAGRLESRTFWKGGMP